MGSRDMVRLLLRATAAIGALVVASAADAHALDPRMGDFYAGMTHPLTALEHVLPIIALGMLVGQRGLKQSQAVLLVFPAAFALGAALATIVAAVTWLFAVNIAWAVLLGVLVAAAPRRFPPAILCAVAGGAALTHGYANGQAMTPDTQPLLFIAGMAIAAFVSLAYVAVFVDFVLRHKPQWLRIAVRALGSWIAAIGILVLSVAHRIALAS
jgi:urease accessory protein